MDADECIFPQGTSLTGGKGVGKKQTDGSKGQSTDVKAVRECHMPLAFILSII
jgi:hypothetical protein